MMLIRFDTPEEAKKRYEELVAKYADPAQDNSKWFAYDNLEYDFEVIYELKDETTISLLIYLGCIDHIAQLFAIARTMREVRR